MNELFEISETLSPRLQWMKEYNVTVCKPSEYPQFPANFIEWLKTNELKVTPPWESDDGKWWLCDEEGYYAGCGNTIQEAAIEIDSCGFNFYGISPTICYQEFPNANEYSAVSECGNIIGTGSTENEALTVLALKMGWKLWNQ